MEHCTNYFDNEAVNTCESYGVVDLPNAISTCVADIQVNSWSHHHNVVLSM